MAINKISKQTLAAMRRKSAATLPDRPSQRGYTAEDIRQALVACLLDPNNSLSAELNRIVSEANMSINNIDTRLDNIDTCLDNIDTCLDDIDTRMNLSIITIDPSEWTDDTPYSSIQYVSAGNMNNGPLTKAAAILLIPMDKNTKQAAQNTELSVDTTNFSLGLLMLSLSRKNAAPTTTLRFAAVTVLVDNPQAGNFPASASFVGVAELPDELMDREVKRVMDEVMAASCPKISVGVHTVGSYQWSDVDPLRANLLTTTFDDHSIVLLIPLDADTRRESQRIEVTVDSYSGGEGYANIVLLASQSYPPPTLTYESLIIKMPDPLPSGFIPTAAIVGVSELSNDFVDREVLAAIERNPQKIATLLQNYLP